MGLLSSLGRRGLRSLESGQMFGQRSLSYADDAAKAESARYMKGQIPHSGVQMIKQKLAAGQQLSESELYAASLIPEYLSPQERQALEMAMDALHAGGGQAYPVQFGRIDAPTGSAAQLGALMSRR